MAGRQIRLLINRWVILGALISAFLMCACMMLVVLYPRGINGATNSESAIMDVIRAPTATATPLEAEATPVGTSSTLENLATLLPGEIGIGVVVQVQETGGDGLRLRDIPGLEGKVLMLGDEAEVFNVVGGPREMDGYTWWYLVGFYDETRQGWGVSNYLMVVENQ